MPVATSHASCTTERVHDAPQHMSTLNTKLLIYCRGFLSLNISGRLGRVSGFPYACIQLQVPCGQVNLGSTAGSPGDLGSKDFSSCLHPPVCSTHPFLPSHCPHSTPFGKRPKGKLVPPHKTSLGALLGRPLGALLGTSYGWGDCIQQAPPRRQEGLGSPAEMSARNSDTVVRTELKRLAGSRCALHV